MTEIWAWLATSILIPRQDFIFLCLYPLALGYYLGRRR